MVKITLEFPTVDLAIVALAKLVPAGKVSGGEAAPRAGVPVEPPVGTIAAPSARKGRSDKGVPRKVAESKNAAPQADGGISVDGTQAGVGKAPAAAAPVPLEEAQAALTELFNKKGAQVAMDLLARYGKTRLSEVPAEDRARLIEEAKGLLGE